jgi:hypothetical protein
MPLYDSVLRTTDGRHEFDAEGWERKTTASEPVGLCPECKRLLYGKPASTPEYGSAVYREWACGQGHEFVSSSSRYRTAPIPDPDRFPVGSRPGEMD